MSPEQFIRRFPWLCLAALILAFVAVMAGGLVVASQFPDAEVVSVSTNAPRGK